jgi:hypothetical protein
MSKLAASASSAFFAFAPGFGEGVPVRQLAENVIEFGTIGCPRVFEPHGKNVAGFEDDDDALFIMAEGHPGAAFYGSGDFVHCAHFTKRAFASRTCRRVLNDLREARL